VRLENNPTQLIEFGFIQTGIGFSFQLSDVDILNAIAFDDALGFLNVGSQVQS